MSSRKEEERNEKIIRGLMKLPPNRRCINCNSLGPQYVCTNFWTFVCMTCSGIHREFTHRVKSVSMSKFTSQEVEALQEGGNQRARETFLKDWDPREQRLPDNSNVEKVREFIKSAYVDKKFFASKASGKPPRDTLNNRNHEDETRRASSYHSYSQSPPYDYQYEERRYGKQAPTLTKKPGSDRGMFRFLSTSRLNDHVQQDAFGNEVSNARVSDFSVTGTQSPPNLSQSSGSGKFDGLDLFSAPNAPQKFDGLDLFSEPNAPQPITTSEPSVEPEKFGGLDLFSAPNAPQLTTLAPPVDLFDLSVTSLASGPPTVSAGQQFKPLDLIAVMPHQQSTAETMKDKSTDTINQKTDGWAIFDMPWHAHAESSQQDFSASGPPSSLIHNPWVDIGAPVNENNNQSWSSLEESITPFETIYTKSSKQDDPLTANPYLTWGISEGGAQSHGVDTKSRNPFDFASDADLESTNMFLDMSSLQSALPNHNMSTSWFPESASIPFSYGKSQDALLFMPAQAPTTQMPNIQAQGPVASIGGNPFG